MMKKHYLMINDVVPEQVCRTEHSVNNLKILFDSP